MSSKVLFNNTEVFSSRSKRLLVNIKDLFKNAKVFLNWSKVLFINAEVFSSQAGRLLVGIKDLFNNTKVFSSRSCRLTTQPKILLINAEVLKIWLEASS